MKWKIFKIDENSYLAEDGNRSIEINNAHCRACAYAELISEHGGKVDLRGLYKNGDCYRFLIQMMLVTDGFL